MMTIDDAVNPLCRRSARITDHAFGSVVKVSSANGVLSSSPAILDVSHTSLEWALAASVYGSLATGSHWQSCMHGSQVGDSQLDPVRKSSRGIVQFSWSFLTWSTCRCANAGSEPAGSLLQSTA